MTLVPAYGRDYKTACETLIDWNNGKDFKIAATGQYCSNRDDIEDVWIRYNQNRMIVSARHTAR